MIGKWRGRNQLAVRGVKHVEEPVLGCLHDNTPISTVLPQGEVSQHDLLRRGVVPAITRCCLIVPAVFPGIRIDREDRREKEVVAVAVRVAHVGVPWRTVTDTDQNLIIHRVVNNRIPGSATAPVSHPSAVISPGLVRQLGEDGIGSGVIRLLLGIRHGVEAPDQLTGFNIIGSDIAAHAQLRSTVANDHFVLEDTGRTGNGVRLALINRDLTPNHLAGRGIQRLQATIKDTDKDFAVMHCNAAVDHVTAAFRCVLARNFRVIDPELFASLGIQGIHHRPGTGDIHHPVDHNRGRFCTTRLCGLVHPANTQLGERVTVDLTEPRVSLLVVGSAVGEPNLRLVSRRGDAIRIHLRQRHTLSSSNRPNGRVFRLSATRGQCQCRRKNKN